MNAQRRPLTFDSLDLVMPEVDRLLNQGYRMGGNWSLGQMCKHLSKAVVGSIDGVPTKAPWLIRQTLGKLAKRSILKSGRVPEGVKLPQDMLPRPDVDDRAEAEALRAALRGFSLHNGPVAPHPFFGAMTYQEWTRLHCIHMAHHLSFVSPSQR